MDAIYAGQFKNPETIFVAQTAPLRGNRLLGFTLFYSLHDLKACVAGREVIDLDLPTYIPPVRPLSEEGKKYVMGK